MAEERVWNTGKPPHMGWWNASMRRDGNLWRWWDGKKWSRGVSSTDSAAYASIQAAETAPFQDEIFWTDYWPENACVPRIDPRQPKAAKGSRG